MENNSFVIDIYNPNLHAETQTYWELISSWILDHISTSISALIGLIVGAFITYLVQKCLKNHDTKIIALANANLIAVMLSQKRASLKKIEDFLEQRSGSKPHQKAFMKPSMLKFDQDQISKLLSFKKFTSSNYANIIQTLTTAEQSYQNCFELIQDYNQIIKNLFELYSKEPTEENTKLIEGYRAERSSCIDNIKKTHNEALTLNRQAKQHFDTHCTAVFKNKYTPLIEDCVVQAIDLHSQLPAA